MSTDYPGNMGALDQIAALDFVRDIIVDFGGDLNRITLFGESSGAAAVSLLTYSPLTRGRHINTFCLKLAHYSKFIQNEVMKNDECSFVLLQIQSSHL